MKKLLVLLAAVIMCGAVANAQLLVEDFNYAGGSALLGQGGWTITGSSVVNPFTVGNAGLTFTGYNSSGIGNALPIANNGQDAYVSIANQTSGSVYMSALVNFSATQFGGTGAAAYVGDYFLHLTQGVITGNFFFARIFVRSADNGNITFGVSKTSTSATVRPTFGDSIYSLNTTYLVVVKYTFNAAAFDDEIRLYVFTSGTLPTTEPGSAYVGPITSGTQADATGLDIVNLRQGSSAQAPTGTVDGIRVGTSWDNTGLPVELTSFTANARGKNVELIWNTATEVNNSGFEVEKNVSGKWSKIGFVSGKGTSNVKNNYSYNDNVAVSGSYSYRLKQIDRDGKFEYSSAVEVKVVGETNTFEVAQNYPNPFNPTTAISYYVPTTGKVLIQVFDMLGKEVATLVNGEVASGAHTAQFNATHLPSGMYFYTLRANNFNETKKMLLVK